MQNANTNIEGDKISMTTIALAAFLFLIVGGFVYYFIATARPAVAVKPAEDANPLASNTGNSAANAVVQIATNPNFDKGVIDLIKTISASAKGEVNANMSA